MCPCHQVGSRGEKQKGACRELPGPEPHPGWWVGGLLTLPRFLGRLAITSHFCLRCFQVFCHRPSNWVQRYTHNLSTQMGLPGHHCDATSRLALCRPSGPLPSACQPFFLVLLASWPPRAVAVAVPHPCPQQKGKPGPSQMLPADAAHGHCCQRLGFHFPTSRLGGDRGEVVGSSCGLASSTPWSKRGWVWGR